MIECTTCDYHKEYKCAHPDNEEKEIEEVSLEDSFSVCKHYKLNIDEEITSRW